MRPGRTLRDGVTETAALLAALALAAIHLLGGRLAFLGGTPRSVWLSLAGGISVGYVFAHLLPELSERQSAIEEDGGAVLPALEDHVYLVALLGLAMFYAVERASQRSRARQRAEGAGDRTEPWAFRLSFASFGVYNALIGYLLVHREDTGAAALAVFTIAMGLHFVVNDFGLREHHKQTYERVGRWILALSVLVGWGVGALTQISDAAIALLIAFIGGGVILNVIKEELPGERESRFLPFAAGAAGYAALLQAV